MTVSQKFQLLGLKYFKNLFRVQGKTTKTPVDACTVAIFVHYEFNIGLFLETKGKEITRPTLYY